MFGRMIESRNNNFYLVLGLILIVAFSRLIPHYPNFTPLCAIALFGAKYFNNKYLAYVLPLFALWIWTGNINGRYWFAKNPDKDCPI